MPNLEKIKGEAPEELDPFYEEKPTIYQSNTGDLITVLPSCTIPHHHLDPNNWLNPVNVGNMRDVYRIKSLKSGEKTYLYIKAPERDFSDYSGALVAGDIWRYVKSENRSVRIDNDSTVENQSVWEIAILLKLYREYILAEIPQALVGSSDGKNSIVIKGIYEHREGYWGDRAPDTFSNVEQQIKNSGIIPKDHQDNIIIDPNGIRHHMDVNRWRWYPEMNDFDQQLLATIKQSYLIKCLRKNPEMHTPDAVIQELGQIISEELQERGVCFNAEELPFEELSNFFIDYKSGKAKLRDILRIIKAKNDYVPLNVDLIYVLKKVIMENNEIDKENLCRFIVAELNQRSETSKILKIQNGGSNMFSLIRINDYQNLPTNIRELFNLYLIP